MVKKTMEWSVSGISWSLGIGTLVLHRCYEWYEAEVIVKRQLLVYYKELLSETNLQVDSLLEENRKLAELLSAKADSLSPISKFCEGIASLLTPTNALLLGGGCLLYFCFQKFGCLSMLKDTLAHQFPSLIQRTTDITGRDQYGNDLTVRVSDWPENGVISIFFGEEGTLLDLGMLVSVRNSYGTLAGNLELEKAALLENARTLEEALKSSQDAVIKLTRVRDQLQADITNLETQLSFFTSESSLSLENDNVLQSSSTQQVVDNASDGFFSMSSVTLDDIERMQTIADTMTFFVS